MRFAAVIALSCLAGAAHAADLAGRWQGVVQIPQRPLHATVDLERDTGGAWSGSIIIPELSIADLPLTDIAEHDGTIGFAISGALAGPKGKPARLSASLLGETLRGTFSQGGNSAPLELHRSGAAQVAPPPRNTPLAAAFAGAWTGDYEMLGYARHVTVTFTPHAQEPGSAQFVIVGKRRNELPVDLLVQHGDFVRIESHQYGINFEGRLYRDAGEIRGTCEQGPIELPLVLKHAGDAP